jgi:hypothetical protein
MERDSFVFYRSFSEAIDDLPDNEQLKVYRAIKEYALNEKEIELTGTARSFFKLIKPQIVANNRRYKNGKKGGRPPEEQKPTDNQGVTKQEPNNNPGKTELEPTQEQGENLQETKQKPNENVNDNENVNEKENVNEPIFDSFSETPLNENIPHDEKPPGDKPPDDKPVETKEDAARIWNKARELWNKLGLKPECRDLMMRAGDTGEILRTFQSYSWMEIKDAIENFAWHKFKAGPEFRPPPPYGSLAGFLKAGVEKYHDTNALDQQFKEDRK